MAKTSTYTLSAVPLTWARAVVSNDYGQLSAADTGKIKSYLSAVFKDQMAYPSYAGHEWRLKGEPYDSQQGKTVVDLEALISWQDPATPDPATPDPAAPDPATPDPATPDPAASSESRGARASGWLHWVLLLALLLSVGYLGYRMGNQPSTEEPPVQKTGQEALR